MEKTGECSFLILNFCNEPNVRILIIQMYMMIWDQTHVYEDSEPFS